MTLIGLLLVLVVAGIVLYLVNTLLPLQESVKKILNVLVVTVLAVVTVVWLLGFLGIDVSRQFGGPHHPLVK